MTLTKKQSKKLKYIIIDLMNLCDEGEVIRPYISYFVIGQGLMEIKYELFYEGKSYYKGSYSDMVKFIKETR